MEYHLLIYLKMKKSDYIWYINFTDEVYAIMCSAKVPLGVNRKTVILAIAGLLHFYWVLGGVLEQY